MTFVVWAGVIVVGIAMLWAVTRFSEGVPERYRQWQIREERKFVRRKTDA